MANASGSSCTLVNTAFVVAGTISGTFLVGMTLSGANVPPGVTIVSGPGGAGTYVVTANSANITTAEPITGSLSWNMPLQGNSRTPQMLDLGRAAGFGFVVAAAFTGGSAGPGQEYQHGTHAVAIHNQQAIAGSHIFAPSPGRQGRSVVPTILTQPQYPEPRPSTIFDTTGLEKKAGFRALQTIIAAPQSVDLTIQPAVYFPQPQQGAGFSQEFHFGHSCRAALR